MKNIFAISRLGLLAAFLFATAYPGTAQTNEFDPPALYLSWQRDPSTTMTIQWHTLDATGRSELQFKKLEGGSWSTAKGSSEPMPYSTRIIHTVELTKLTADTYYLFRFTGNAREYKFRTMPLDLKKPVRFISGGDVYHQRDLMDQMNALAAKLDPAFVVLGGDLAYAVGGKNSDKDNVQRWYDYFDSWKQLAVAPDGRLIPHLVTIGNHEVVGFWDKTPADALGFYALFAMPGKQGYNHLDFGNYMTLLLLDSQHTRPVAGAQTKWLEQTLSKRKRVPHLFPVYHIPGYPSVRSFDGGENGHISAAIREHWSPLFEKHGVKISFENHEHAFKRTHPIRNGKVDMEGVTYLGDGAWGVRLRETHPADTTWYLAKAGAIRHMYLVTLYPDQRHIVAVDGDGKIFDEIYQRVEKSRALKP
ncbi:MAG: metallophosphoesterase family protein [Verrucomicrobia bacterium]|nr:metallophosphoesterase family protein [Verrucomicrobiota bacterium]